MAGCRSEQDVFRDSCVSLDLNIFFLNIHKINNIKGRFLAENQENSKRCLIVEVVSFAGKQISDMRMPRLVQASPATLLLSVTTQMHAEHEHFNPKCKHICMHTIAIRVCVRVLCVRISRRWCSPVFVAPCKGGVGGWVENLY